MEKCVKDELVHLEKRRILERVPNDISEYASPIVVVAKYSSEAVQICRDFKVSINKGLFVEQYPLPSVDELITKIGASKVFAKFNMSKVFHKIQLNEKAQKYLVINTQKGLYKYKHLLFGIASASTSNFSKGYEWVAP